MKVKKTYRIDENALIELDELAKKQEMSQTDAIHFAIHFAIQMPDTSHTLDKAYLLLEKELAVKNQQIADLSTALLAAQDTAKAAQALHAVDKKEDLILESTEQKTTRWQRLKQAWTTKG